MGEWIFCYELCAINPFPSSHRGYANGDIPDEYYDNADMLFTIFFGTEILLKLIGFGAQLYFEDPWNVYDFIIVLMAVIEKCVQWCALQPCLCCLDMCSAGFLWMQQWLD